MLPSPTPCKHTNDLAAQPVCGDKVLLHWKRCPCCELLWPWSFCAGMPCPQGVRALWGDIRSLECGPSSSPRLRPTTSYMPYLTGRSHGMTPGLRALGEALLPATKLETGTKLHLSDLAAACRHGPCLLLWVTPFAENV